MTVERKYWFRAKRYGWGWGLPTAWQGWVLLAIFVSSLVIGAVVLLPTHGPTMFIAFAAVVIAVAIAVCWLTGEPPRWRWGDR